jgi:hypothetical protein
MTILRALVPALLLTLAAPAQTAAPQPAAVKATPVQAKESDYVTTREFKSRLFLLKHQSPFSLVGALKALGSGFRGADVTAVDREGVKTITVRDFPENLAAIEEAIQRLDVPSALRTEVELRIHVLLASRQPVAGDGFPEELKEVLAALRDTLNYRGFTLVSSFTQRAQDGSEHIQGRGQAEVAVKAPKGEAAVETLGMSWQIRSLRVDPGQNGTASLDLKNFLMNVSERGSTVASLVTDIAMKDGDKVVVGSSVYRDKGLIVVVTAKVLR